MAGTSLAKINEEDKNKFIKFLQTLVAAEITNEQEYEKVASDFRNVSKGKGVDFDKIVLEAAEHMKETLPGFPTTKWGEFSSKDGFDIFYQFAPLKIKAILKEGGQPMLNVYSDKFAKKEVTSAINPKVKLTVFLYDDAKDNLNKIGESKYIAFSEFNKSKMLEAIHSIVANKFTEVTLASDAFQDGDTLDYDIKMISTETEDIVFAVATIEVEEDILNEVKKAATAIYPEGSTVVRETGTQVNKLPEPVKASKDEELVELANALAEELSGLSIKIVKRKDEFNRIGDIIDIKGSDGEVEDLSSHMRCDSSNPKVGSDLYEIYWLVEGIKDGSLVINEYSDLDALERILYAYEAYEECMDEDESEATTAGTYDDFMESYESEVNNLLKKLRSVKLDDTTDEQWERIERKMNKYDKNVGETIQHWMLRREIGAREVAQFAMDNQHKYGTEVKQIVNALEDFANCLGIEEAEASITIAVKYDRLSEKAKLKARKDYRKGWSETHPNDHILEEDLIAIMDNDEDEYHEDGGLISDYAESAIAGKMKDFAIDIDEAFVDVDTNDILDLCSQLNIKSLQSSEELDAMSREELLNLFAEHALNLLKSKIITSLSEYLQKLKNNKTFHVSKITTAESKNKDHGFFHTVKLNFDLTDSMTTVIWNFIVTKLQGIIPDASESDCEDLLDATWGRHLADELTFYTKEKGKVRELKLAITEWAKNPESKWVIKAHNLLKVEMSHNKTDSSYTDVALPQSISDNIDYLLKSMDIDALGFAPEGHGTWITVDNENYYKAMTILNKSLNYRISAQHPKENTFFVIPKYKSISEKEAEAKYGDVKGQEPADKDIQRMKDLETKAKGDEAKMLKLAQNMANTLGVSPDSVDKAIRRAKAAEIVYPGPIGKKIAKIFMDIAVEQKSAANLGKVKLEVVKQAKVFEEKYFDSFDEATKWIKTSYPEAKKTNDKFKKTNCETYLIVDGFIQIVEQKSAAAQTLSKPVQKFIDDCQSNIFFHTTISNDGIIKKTTERIIKSDKGNDIIVVEFEVFDKDNDESMGKIKAMIKEDSENGYKQVNLSQWRVGGVPLMDAKNKLSVEDQGKTPIETAVNYLYEHGSLFDASREKGTVLSETAVDWKQQVKDILASGIDPDTKKPLSKEQIEGFNALIGNVTNEEKLKDLETQDIGDLMSYATDLGMEHSYDATRKDLIDFILENEKDESIATAAKSYEWENLGKLNKQITVEVGDEEVTIDVIKDEIQEIGIDCPKFNISYPLDSIPFDRALTVAEKFINGLTSKMIQSKDKTNAFLLACFGQSSAVRGAAETKILIATAAEKKVMTEEQEEKLMDIYQESIDKYAGYWETARENNDPDVVVDQIWCQCQKEIGKIFGVEETDDLYDIYDYGPRDWLYENVDAGIN